jgi:hypothetical protein
MGGIFLPNWVANAKNKRPKEIALKQLIQEGKIIETDRSRSSIKGRHAGIFIHFQLGPIQRDEIGDAVEYDS